MDTFLFFLAIWHGANGLFMLAAPEVWYQSVPGVTETGPYNGHFVADIAMAFLASAAGLVLAARINPVMVPAALIAPAVFLGGHAVLHFLEFFHGTFAMAEIARDTFTILLPGLLPAWFLWAGRSTLT